MAYIPRFPPKQTCELSIRQQKNGNYCITKLEFIGGKSSVLAKDLNFADIQELKNSIEYYARKRFS